MSEGPLATTVLSVRTNRVGRLGRRPSFRGISLVCTVKCQKPWPAGQVLEPGSQPPPAAVPSVALATAAAAATTTPAAEGPELELSVPSAAAHASLAAVAAASIAGLA